MFFYCRLLPQTTTNTTALITLLTIGESAAIEAHNMSRARRMPRPCAEDEGGAARTMSSCMAHVGELGRRLHLAARVQRDLPFSSATCPPRGAFSDSVVFLTPRTATVLGRTYNILHNPSLGPSQTTHNRWNVKQSSGCPNAETGTKDQNPPRDTKQDTAQLVKREERRRRRRRSKEVQAKLAQQINTRRGKQAHFLLEKKKKKKNPTTEKQR